MATTHRGDLPSTSGAHPHVYGSRRRVSTDLDVEMARNIEAWAQGVEVNGLLNGEIEDTADLAEFEVEAKLTEKVKV